MGALFFLARRFVAGETREAAIEAVRALNADGILTTLDFLGENVTSGKEAEAAADEYVAVLEAVAEARVAANVSLKLTQMGLDLSDDLALRHVRRVVEAARRSHNFVRVDMEGSAYTQRTLDLFRTLRKQYDNVGIVLQAYLHRSEQDAREMAAGGLPVRVCKGAYREPPSIAFRKMSRIRESFKRMVEILLRGGSKVGIATHDDRLIDWAVRWTGAERIPRDRFEFQMLYGLRRKRARALAEAGYAVRSYVPFGTHWFPYFVRRLRERKENIFFVLRGVISD